METFSDLKSGLETAFDSEGAKGVEATIQINIEDLTNFYVDINDGNLSDEVLREFKLMSERDQAVAKARLEN